MNSRCACVRACVWGGGGNVASSNADTKLLVDSTQGKTKFVIITTTTTTAIEFSFGGCSSYDTTYYRPNKLQ